MIRPFAAAAAAALLLFSAPALAGSHKHDHAHEEHGHEKHDDHDHHDHGDHHKAEMNGIVALHAWTPANEGDTALVFVEIENESVADILLEGGECACAAKVELVEVDSDSPVGPLHLHAGEDLLLSPKTHALRLSGLKSHLHKGEEFEMELAFSTGHLDIHVQVEAEGAKEHSHAGHAH